MWHLTLPVVHESRKSFNLVNHQKGTYKGKTDKRDVDRITECVAL